MTGGTDPGAGAGSLAADGRLSQIVALTGRLTAAIEREKALLEARRPRELDAALAEKESLADLYAREMRALAKERQWLEAASPGVRDMLRDAVGNLRSLLADYGRTLVARRTLTEGLVQALGQEVARQRQPFTGYGAARSMPNARATHFACDQSA